MNHTCCLYAYYHKHEDMDVNMHNTHINTHTHKHTELINGNQRPKEIPSKSNKKRDLGENRAVMLIYVTSWKNYLATNKIIQELPNDKGLLLLIAKLYF